WLCEQAGNAQEAGHQMPAALAWCDAKGRRSCRQTAQAQRDEASQQLRGAWWRKVKRLLRAERTRRHVGRLPAHLPSAISAPVWRDAVTRLWSMNDPIRQVPGDASMRVRHLVVIAQV